MFQITLKGGGRRRGTPPNSETLYIYINNHKSIPENKITDEIAKSDIRLWLPNQYNTDVTKNDIQ